MSAIWRISLSNLSRNLLEATELANVLQEVSSSIQVTGLSSSHSARTSSSASGSLTTISTRERIKSALPLHISAASFPWEQLVGVVSSEALQEPPYSADKQPQLVEVNTGGNVFFLFFELTREQYLQQLHLLQRRQQQDQQQQQQLSEQPGGDSTLDAEASTSSSNGGASPTVAATEGAAATAPAPADPKAAAALEELALVVAHNRTSSGSIAAADVILPKAPLIATIASSNGPYVREGVAVLKVGFNRLAMQAEQFANELTRHLGIAAPDCRIVRQVGRLQAWLDSAVNVLVVASCSASRARALRSKLDMRTLVLHGQDDVALGEELLTGIAAAVPQSTVKLFRNCSHWIQQDYPQQVTEVMQEWLQPPAQKGQ